MNNYAFTFVGSTLEARPDGSLWWPDQSLLCVSDLHLGKSERIARRGGTLLPPYETQETLWRLEEAISQTDPATVVCLGDSFDDLGALQALDQPARQMISGLQAGRKWIWIEGNHDPGPVDLGGEHLAQLSVGALSFRHIASSDDGAEVSGHYHPKAGINGLGTRPCFLVDGRRIIMPAFGAYTGGLSVSDPVLTSLVTGSPIVILTGRKAIAAPLKGLIKRR